MNSGKLLQTKGPQELELPRPTTVGAARGFNETEEPALFDYLHILLKRKWIIASCVVIGTVLVTISTFRTPRLYDAVGRLAIFRENSEALGLKTPDVDTDDIDISVTVDTQARILQSDAIALQVIRQLRLDQNPYFGGTPSKNSSAIPVANPQISAERENSFLGSFHGGLKVKSIPGTRILEVHFVGPDPKLDAEIVNTLTNVYIEQNFKTRFESTVQTSEWLSNQLSDLQLKVETSEQRLVDYQKQHGIVGVDDKQNVVVTKLDLLNRELTAAEAERIPKESVYRMILSGNPEMIAKQGSADVLGKLREQESALKLQLAQLSLQFGPAHPKVKEIKVQLAGIQDAIPLEIDKIREKAKLEYLEALDREKMLNAAYEDQKRQANQLNESAIQYNILKREYDSNRQLYEGLLQKLKEAGISASLKSSNIRIIDPARVPMSPSSPNVPRNIAMGFFLSLFGGIGLAFVLDMLDNTIRTPEQVGAFASLPSLGVIPSNLALNGARNGVRRTLRLTSGTHDSGAVEIVAHAHPRSQVAESYRALRTSILLSSPEQPPKVILVTSAMPQDGKTTTCINTAIVLAQRGARVMLVDADLRRPNIHKVLALDNACGLSTYLAGDRDPSPIVPWPELPNVSVLPAGPQASQPAELLSSETMARSLETWRQEYDYIIIDTPPILSVTDAVHLSVEADSVILVIRSGRTTKQALRRARDLLLQVNTRTLGVVLNAMDLRSSDYYYYYYGYYGPKYG